MYESINAPWIIRTEGDVTVYDVCIDTGSKEKPVEIALFTDIHFNAINDRDREENNEHVISSYNDPVLWLKDGASRVNLERCFKVAEGADQIVMTGDLMSYLSYGNLELVKKYVFEPCPSVMAVLGNHDPLRSWRAAADERDTLDERLKILEDNWIHDIYYSSKVIGNRVMLIQLDNGLKSEYSVPDAFWERQIEPFKKDLATAREKGYTVLLFYHIPISARDERFDKCPPIASKGIVANLSSNLNVIGPRSTGASKTVYELIVNNGDIIKGAFCGHIHANYYTEIRANGADGNEYFIPQHTLTGVPYNKGHVMKIKVK
jgi:predicted MPP superfamily phosphohydrolase